MRGKTAPRYVGPLHQQVAMALEKEIVGGAYSVGQPLPGEQDLASRFQVSVGTMRRALTSLTKRGLISRQRGRGTIIVQTNSSSLNYVATRAGSDPEFIDFKARIDVCPDAVCKALDLDPGVQVVVAERTLQLQDGSRIFGHIYWPAAFCPQLSSKDTILLEDWEREYGRLGIAFGVCTESVTAIAATDDLATKLKVAAGSPILRVTRVVRSETLVLEFAVGYCALKDTEFHFRS